MTEMGALSKFFGRLPGQSLSEFASEVRCLSNDEKTELATLAAKELGLELK